MCAGERPGCKRSHPPPGADLLASTLCGPPAHPTAPAALWEAQRLWLQHALARLALGLGMLAAAATLVANAWGVPAINRQLLPQVQAAASAMLQREVALGAVRWVAPTGLIGLTPLGSLGPVCVGPGTVERSSAEVQEVTVVLDPVQSALQGRVVLTVKARGAQVRGAIRLCRQTAPGGWTLPPFASSL